MLEDNYVTNAQATAGTTGSVPSWEAEDRFWQSSFRTRPYARADQFYEQFRPAYRYGFDSATHSLGRTWQEAEPDLRSDWERYEHRGGMAATWDDIKDAVRDAWNRVSGQRH